MLTQRLTVWEEVSRMCGMEIKNEDWARDWVEIEKKNEQR